MRAQRQNNLTANQELDYRIKNCYQYTNCIGGQYTFFTVPTSKRTITIDIRVLTNDDCRLLIEEGFTFLFENTDTNKPRIRVSKDRKIITH